MLRGNTQTGLLVIATATEVPTSVTLTAKRVVHYSEFPRQHTTEIRCTVTVRELHGKTLRNDACRVLSPVTFII